MLAIVVYAALYFRGSAANASIAADVLEELRPALTSAFGTVGRDGDNGAGTWTRVSASEYRLYCTGHTEFLG